MDFLEFVLGLNFLCFSYVKLEIGMVKLCLLVIGKFDPFLVDGCLDGENLIQSLIFVAQIEDEAARSEVTMLFRDESRAIV